MARRDYGFVRSYASLGRDTDDLLNLLAAGYSGALFDYNDPYLAQAVADARAAKIPFGIWGDPNAVNNDPRVFAQRMAQVYNQYSPDLLVPDIEFVGKGYEGSPGWNWSQQAAAYWKQFLPGVRTAVTVMPNQNDFNYGAWQGLGNTEWLPQAYGADPNTQVFDPRQVVQTLINRGVDPSLISPVLGPGHQSGYEGAGLWTIDDFIGKTVPKAYGQGSPDRLTGGSSQGSGTTTPPRPGRLSQSQQQVASQGLKWGGQLFGSPEQFINQYLKPRNLRYSDWAAKHPLAAQGFSGRGRAS